MSQVSESEGDQGSLRSIYKDHNLQFVFAVTLMSVLGTASVTPAFPSVQQELGVSSDQVWLLVGVFTFPGVLLTAILGALSDRLGRRKILVPSLILFGLAGSICAVVRDFDTLLVLRTLQGIGAVPLWSLNHTIIGDLYSGRERAAAFGYNESVLSVGSMIFPTIGGVLATFGWYYPFALSVVAVPPS
jgi:ACDE family multidrug resistance protein